MSLIHFIRKKLIPQGSRLEEFLRSIRYTLSRIKHEGLSAFLTGKDAGINSLGKSISPGSTQSQNHLHGIQYFKVDEDITSIPATTALVSGQADFLQEHSNQALDRIIEGITARSKYDQERQDILHRGQELFAGKRLLFVLPIAAAGGGANLILLAAKTLRNMSVDAQIYNLPTYRAGFEQAYPENDVPMVYDTIENLPKIAGQYDAVVATSYITVYWLKPVNQLKPGVILGYYIQDYEPYFDEPGTDGYKKAAASYTLFPGLVRGCTTPWISDEIQSHSSNNLPIPVTVIGASLDIDLFMPRPGPDPELPNRPLRVAAMIRPSTPRRNPHLTMQLMQRLSREYGDRIELVIFGAELAELQQAQMPLSIPFKLTGRLNQKQVANLMNLVDIFVDYSTFQGLGLTALEAMACGVASIVPSRGGTSVYARHEENCLVVDTQDQAACFKALQRLVEDGELRHKLQRNAIYTSAQFYPELPAFNFLKALFTQDA